MTQTCFGELATPDGLATAQTIAAGPDGHVELQQRSWATPADQIRSVQPSWIPIDRDHQGPQIGRIVHLEIRHGRLWAVGEISDDAPLYAAVRVGDELRHVQIPLFFSIDRTHHSEHFGDIEIHSVGIVAHTARLSAKPIAIRAGNAHDAAWNSTDRTEKELLQRATEAHLTRHGHAIAVADLDRRARSDAWVGRRIDQNNLGEWLAFEDDEQAARARPIEYRQGHILGVR